MPTRTASPIEIFNLLDVWHRDLPESTLNFNDDESLQFDPRDSQDQDLYNNDDPPSLDHPAFNDQDNSQPYFGARFLGVAEMIAAAVRITKVILLNSLFPVLPEKRKGSLYLMTHSLYSSAGQSVGLINPRSWVRSPLRVVDVVFFTSTCQGICLLNQRLWGVHRLHDLAICFVMLRLHYGRSL